MFDRPRRWARRAALLAVGAAVALVTVHDASSAGGEASRRRPAPLSVIEHPFLLGMEGTWDVAVEGGPPGTPPSTARSTFRIALGGTTLMHDWDGATPMGALHGHGLYRVNRDGRGVTCWWFDSNSREPIKMIGPLTESGAELSGSSPQGVVTIVWRRGPDTDPSGDTAGAEGDAVPTSDGKASRLDFKMTVGEVEVMRQSYRRAP